MADGEIFRLDEVGGGGQQAVIEITTTSGKPAYAFAALTSTGGGGGGGSGTEYTEDAAALPVVPLNIVFPTPLRGTAAAAINIQLGTTGASVFWNAQGFTAP